VPSLRSRIIRHGLVAAVTALRRSGEGSPDPDGPVEELEAYALRLRAQMEELGNRLPPSRGSHAVAARRAPVSSLWVASDRVVGDVAALEQVPIERIVDAGASDPDLLARADRVTLHVHGGGYCMGSPVTHRGLAGALSRTTHGPVLLPDYRLAPEDPFPAALDDVVAVYRWLVDDLGVDPRRVAVTGDSAGGGLAASLLVRLRDEGRPLPAGYVGMSPWVDLAATGATMTALAAVDPWLTAGLVLPAGRAYAGDTPLDHPQVSPLYADLRGLPPMLVHVGSDEILLDDAVRLVDRARGAGVDASLGRFDGLWHVFQAFPGMPESRDSLREICGFVRRQTASAPPLRRAAGTDLRRTA
jgi:epsilon-lactone hydrolase